MKIKTNYANVPCWKEVNVKSHIPESLKMLEEMARNIWWAWSDEATEMFSSLDPELWSVVGQNPVALLERISYEKLEDLSSDEAVLAKINKVYKKFKEYIDVKPDASRPSVAYFCMEYGLTHVLKIYSGGLGILAGDYLKEASDSNVDMCGVGLWTDSRLQIMKHRTSAVCLWTALKMKTDSLWFLMFLIWTIMFMHMYGK